MLSFLEPLWVLRVCSGVCTAFQAASLDPRCWPSLRFRCRRAERWAGRLYTILLPTCAALQSLVLDLQFEDPSLALALPAGLVFPALQRLVLRLCDAEAVRFGAELLSMTAGHDLS